MLFLPWVTVGVEVTMEPFEKDERLAERCVLLVKRYRVSDSVST